MWGKIIGFPGSKQPRRHTSSTSSILKDCVAGIVQVIIYYIIYIIVQVIMLQLLVILIPSPVINIFPHYWKIQ